ncbi:MAG TPA: hypothetical protein DCY07_05090 [Rhodospirillaceae bacterium]|nr:hypothetical protein [Rhodospirillaceae bacterium]
MAGTEQLPVTQYAVGGQVTLANYQVISSSYGFEEDTESKKTALGQHKCDLTYSRRQTLSLTLELDSAATETTYMDGGTIASGTFTLADGITASGWEIRSVSKVNTRGPVQLNIELVSLVDLITD